MPHSLWHVFLPPECASAGRQKLRRLNRHMWSDNGGVKNRDQSFRMSAKLDGYGHVTVTEKIARDRKSIAMLWRRRFACDE